MTNEPISHPRAITLQTRLDTSLLQLADLQAFVGKRVIITVISAEADSTVEAPRQWDSLGDLDLGGELDHINLRDYAHD